MHENMRELEGATDYILLYRVQCTLTTHLLHMSYVNVNVCANMISPPLLAWMQNPVGTYHTSLACWRQRHKGPVGCR